MRPTANLEEVLNLVGDGRAGLATDFDGTISAIVSPPEAAVPLPGVEQALRVLTERLAVVALVSGRGVADLAARVDVPGALYVGNHGLERRQHVASQPTHLTATPTAEESFLLEAAALSLKARLTPLVGVRIEDKGLGLAVHYRDAPRPGPVRALILQCCHTLAGERLEIREGKQVVELVLPRGTNKGTAMSRIARDHDLRGLVFLGDDLTDRDGFAATARLRADGLRTLSIAVRGPETPAAVLDAADAVVAGPSAAAGLVVALARAPRLQASPVPT